MWLTFHGMLFGPLWLSCPCVGVMQSLSVPPVPRLLSSVPCPPSPALVPVHQQLLADLQREQFDEGDEGNADLPLDLDFPPTIGDQSTYPTSRGASSLPVLSPLPMLWSPPPLATLCHHRLSVILHVSCSVTALVYRQHRQPFVTLFRMEVTWDPHSPASMFPLNETNAIMALIVPSLSLSFTANLTAIVLSRALYPGAPTE